MLLATQSSLYEIDEANNRVRRLSGINPPTEHFGVDNEWRDYVDLIWQPTGAALFVWPGYTRGTLTTPGTVTR